MQYRELIPSSFAQGLIKCFWTLKDNEDSVHEEEPIVPDGCPEIIFNLSAPFQRLCASESEAQPKSIVVGQMKSVVNLQPTGRIDLFGVRFRPFGIGPLLRDDVNKLTGRIEAASSVFGQRGAQLEEQINVAASDEERISVFENAFRSELTGAEPTNTATALALSLIDTDPSGVRINRIAQDIGVSVKHLERKFKREIGLTPKFLARIVRVQRVLLGFDDHHDSTWTDICYTHGFSDQSHMIREFRSIAGAAPQAFVRQNRSISDLFTG